MKKNYKISSFTLIEVVVSITILGIIMISVMTIFVYSTEISRKSEINRAMQENVKNIIETISEDIRKNGIIGISDDILNPCNLNISSGKYINGDELCTTNNNYYLAKEISGNLQRVDLTQCNDIESHCIISKNGDPLSNSQVSIKNLKFFISNDFDIPKITILLSLQPSIKKGVKIDLIKESRIDIETTISLRKF